MKVQELVRRLNQLDPQLEIFCYREDAELLASDHGFRLLDILDVSVVNGEKKRGDDRYRPQAHVVIEVTADF